jgi:polar amino acid transport system substrate-binding protein
MQIERSSSSRSHWLSLAFRAIATPVVLTLSCGAATPVLAATLEHIKETGHIKFGYLADAPPFTSGSGSTAPEGYSAALCKLIAEQVKTNLSLADLTVEWVPVTGATSLHQVQPGGIDVLCTPISATLTRRRDVAFSIPVYPGGVRAVVRADAPAALRDALAESPRTRPVWRGSPAATVLGKTTLAVVSGTTAESILKERLAIFQIDSKVVDVPDYRTALQQLRDHKVDVVFGDPAVIHGAMDEASRKDLVILDRQMTYEPYALALPRNDDDFRLLVDTVLSQAYMTNAFPELYAKSFGAPDEKTREFFRRTVPRE